MAAKPFILERIIDAPRDAVWRAWTQAGELAQWFGPKGLACEVHKMDLQPGGIMHYRLSDAEHGIDIWGKWSFREITAPERLVVEINFSDADCGVTRHPFAADWPLRTLSATTFKESGDAKTIVTTQWDTIESTRAEQAMFDNGHAGMNQGWGGMMDQLAQYLAK
ncbi:MAG: Activator of Hsp90 ATPase 1 family protein [Micavibrio sp.]|nr:Activator of Hsp90 ATPase 1 family protein [Micavibrio sp.]